ncbi:Inositol-pentakisphosphate 2-kinase [Rhinocladiella similis]
MSTTPQSHIPSPECPTSLTGAELDLHYLAEGAANIIYSVSVRSPSTLQDHSHCCVMRLRKDLPSTKPVVEVMSDFETRIVPLFTDTGHESLLLTQDLYKLTPALVGRLNDELHEMEIVDTEADTTCKSRPRPHHRRHKYLPAYEHEQYGLLMQNLQGPGIDWLVEFKPKWLVQSPSAPSDAKSCRTCALNAMRRRNQSHQGRGDSGFCPLDLLEHDDVLDCALDKIWPPQLNRDGLSSFAAQFKAKVQPALYHLRRLQREQGAVGINDFQTPLDESKDFGVAMALRDCSCFLALKHHANDDNGVGDGVVDLIDVKFADLDLKSTEGGKLEKWAAMEQDLLVGGWYTCSDLGCSLSRVNP